MYITYSYVSNYSRIKEKVILTLPRTSLEFLLLLSIPLILQRKENLNIETDLF